MTRKERYERLSRQAEGPKPAIRDECGSRHVPCFFQQGDEKEEQQDLRQEDHRSRDSTDDPVHQQSTQRTIFHRSGDPLPDGSKRHIDPLHRYLCHPVDRSEHDDHHQQEEKGTGDGMNQHTVESIISPSPSAGLLGTDRKTCLRQQI